MLQRAANNVNTSWWASNVRAKQSKWLDSDVQEMEKRVKSMLKIVEGDGDSFSKKAEMYFKKRPELIQFVEETYKSYKALADKYDHLSTELHKANHTIAAACPEKLQIEKEDEDDSNLPKAIDVADSKPKENHTVLKKSRDSRIDSQQSKEKAEEEIDRLQKEIVVLETEKEYIKCSYESGIAKCLDIEKRIAEIQEEVFLLQNEFNANVEVSKDVAYNLMAATALKSCEDSVAKLQEQHEKVREEIERIKNAKEKADCNSEEKTSDKKEKLENISGNLALENISNKINELVSRVINLELTSTSQASQIKSMKLDVNLLGQSMNAGNSAATAANNFSEGSRKAHAKSPSLEDFIFCEYSESEKDHLQVDEQEANMITSQTSYNTNEIDKKNQELAEMAIQITKLKNDNLTKDKEIQNLKREIITSQAKNKMNERENKSNELIKMARQIMELKNDNSTKDEELQNLKYLLPNDKKLESSDKCPSLEVLFEGSDKDNKSLNSDVEKKYRTRINKVQEENVQFWIKFCTSFQNKQKFQTTYNELLAEIINPNPEYISIDKRLRDLKNELLEWLEENTVMQEELECKVSCINRMQGEISKTSGENHVKLTLKRELLNMQNENSKVAHKLQVGIDQIIGLHSEIDKTLQGIHEKFEDKRKKFQHSCTKKNIPLKTFLNMELTKKKQSIFARLKSKKNKLGRVNSMPVRHL